MDALFLARLQFAVVTVYHFFFVPLTLGLSVLIAIMETIYVRTGDEAWKKATKFWGKLFLINFAMGVATGIVQEFQFGMNWSQYSRFMGDIFGAPLAIEALLAFYIESTFLGVWIFGWDKLSRKSHALMAWLVAIGSNLSAIWILIANSFMQEPVGYVLRNGRAEMKSFAELVTNPHIFYQWPHVFTSAVATAGFFVAGISAWHILRKSDNIEIFRRSFRLAAVYGFVGVVLVAMGGHAQAQHMVKAQPMKMAAAEALWESADPAPISMFAISNTEEQRNSVDIRLPIPGLLSFLAYNSFTGEVKGIKNIQEEYVQKYGPGDYIPPVNVSYWTFRLMVGVGTLMLLLSTWSVWVVFKKKVLDSPLLMKLMFWSIGMPFFAISMGWIFTEMARQPWIVFGLQKTAEGLSNTVPAGNVAFSLLAFTLLYAGLIVVDVSLLKKYARAGIVDEAQAAAAAENS